MKKYYKFDLDVVVANVVAIVVLGILMVLYLMYKKSGTFYYGGIGIIVMFLYFALHEIFHGIGYSLYVKNKMNIKYGAVLEKGVFYAMCQK